MRQTSLYTNGITLILLSFLIIGCSQEKVVSVDKMPKEIKEYASTHFPDNKMIQATAERNFIKKNYEIMLDGNIQLEFNGKLEIIDINGNSKLPDSVIPKKIRDYISENHSQNYLTSWEMDDGKQKVELDNGLDLEFNLNGDFIKIDD